VNNIQEKKIKKEIEREKRNLKNVGKVLYYLRDYYKSRQEIRENRSLAFSLIRRNNIFRKGVVRLLVFPG